MKIALFSASAFLLAFTFGQQSRPVATAHIALSDTGHINHTLDGSVAEWPAATFQPDEDTTIFFALDNDDKNLYVAMTIPDFSMQAKLMRNGMEIYIDLKGKKKEGRGVEFPIKGEVNSFTTNAPASPPAENKETSKPPPPKQIDKKTQRSIMSLGLTACKVFGMENTKSSEQGLVMPGGVNIQFKWDADDRMHIEYLLPLRLLGDNASLDKKMISVGWKVNGFDRSQIMDRPGINTPGSVDDFSQGKNNPGSVGFNNTGRRPERPRSMAELVREQDFWTKYTFNIEPVKKGF